MSEAPWSTASATIRFTIRMTGAASDFFRRSSRSFPSESWESCTHLDLALVHDVLDDGAEGRSEVVVLVDGPEDVGPGGDERLDGEAGGEPDVLERLEAQRVGHRDVQVAVIDRDGDDEVFPGDLFLDEFDRLGLHGGDLQVDHGNAELHGEGLGDLLFRGQPEAYDHLPDLSRFERCSPRARANPSSSRRPISRRSSPSRFFAIFSRFSWCGAGSQDPYPSTWVKRSAT